MKRYICDRCQRELQVGESIIKSSIKEKLIYPSETVFKDKIVELCRDCRNKLNAIDDKLEDICADMYEEFMRGEKR